MNLDIEVPYYTELLTDLSHRIDAGEHIKFVPYDLFRRHCEITTRAADLSSEFILQLQQSVTHLQKTQAEIITKLAEAVKVLNINTARIDKQSKEPAWAGHGLS